jgi:hypothetical protein
VNCQDFGGTPFAVALRKDPRSIVLSKSFQLMLESASFGQDGNLRLGIGELPLCYCEFYALSDVLQ